MSKSKLKSVVIGFIGILFITFLTSFLLTKSVSAKTAACKVIAGSTAIYPVPYQGIYVLGPNDGTLRNTATATDYPYVDGYAMRTTWTSLDSGVTTPNYNFQIINDALDRIQPAGKRLSLFIDPTQVPQYVLASSTYTYNADTPLYTGTTTLPWDPAALSNYQNFINSLSNYQVCDHSSGQFVALKNHPTLSGIRIGIIGAGKLRQSDNLGIFAAPSYSRTNLQGAVLTQINDMKTAFPNTTTWIAYFSIKDNITDPSLDSYMINSIAPLHVGFFQELLKGDTPTVTSDGGLNLLSANSLGGFTNFQACGAWTVHSPCTFSSGDDSPANGLSFGYGNYGSKYFELYNSDLVNPSFAADLQVWHTLLQN